MFLNTLLSSTDFSNSLCSSMSCIEMLHSYFYICSRRWGIYSGKKYYNFKKLKSSAQNAKISTEHYIIIDISSIHIVVIEIEDFEISRTFQSP